MKLNIFICAVALVVLWIPKLEGKGRLSDAPPRMEIPYTTLSPSAGSPVIEVRVKGEIFRFIFDTGSPFVVVSDRLTAKLGLKHKGGRRVGDVHGNRERMDNVVLPELYLPGSGQGIGAANVKCMVMDSLNYLVDCLDIDGIIGCSLFGDYAIIFDSEQKLLIFSKKRSEIDALTDKWGFMHHRKDRKPYIEVEVGESLPQQERRQNLLFDSGDSGGDISLGNLEKYAKSGDILKYEYTRGVPSAVGLHGNAANIIREERGFLNSIRLCGVRLDTLPVGRSSIPRLSVDIIQFGRLVLDFPQNRYCFIPFEKQPSPKYLFASVVCRFTRAGTGFRPSGVRSWVNWCRRGILLRRLVIRS